MGADGGAGGEKGWGQKSKKKKKKTTPKKQTGEIFPKKGRQKYIAKQALEHIKAPLSRI